MATNDSASAGMSAFTIFMMVLMFIVLLVVIWFIFNQFNKSKKVDIEVKPPGGMKVLEQKDLKYTTFDRDWIMPAAKI